MNSVLNPEAPEFYPHFTSVTQSGYKTVHNTIRSSNNLPTGVGYGLFKTFTDFNIVTGQLSENVLLQSNQIIATEIPIVKFTRHDDEHNTELLADANDSLLDRINIHIDTANGVNVPKDIFFKANPKSLSAPTPWNQGPIITKIQVGSATFIGAKNIPRPQLNFKDKIDNSESLWVPKISDKPNSIKPLALNILYNDEGEAVGYEHPYKVELDLYQPPAHFVEPDLEEVPYPAKLEDTPLIYVDTEAKLDALVEHLNTVNELAVDLEHHSYRTYQGITCLIQISTKEGGDYIIDTLVIREHIHKLNLAFTDPKKIKVFHGAESDVIWLQRDFGVYLVGLFDTHQAAKVLNLPGLSLKFLLMKYCNVDADKKYQLADWRIRPLPEELLNYARMDTHYLLYIWRLMKAELLSKGDSQPHLLLSVFEQSRQICGATYNKEIINESSHMPLYIRSKMSFNNQQMAALKMLYKWRDAQARALDESCTYLLPNHMLMTLADILPREVQGVNALCDPMPPFVRQNLLTIHRMILSCRQLPKDTQPFQAPRGPRNVLHANPPRSYNIHDLPPAPPKPSEGEEASMTVEPSVDFYQVYDEHSTTLPDPKFQIVSPDSTKSYETIVSALNAEAKQFIPPYDRYRKYRSLAQIEEIKEFKEKEAKVAAIGKGNELIKTEVLIKLQQAKTQIENEEKKNVSTKVVIDDSDIFKKPQQRKRKISTDKTEHKECVDNASELKKKEETGASTSGAATTKTSRDSVKTFQYKNVDYKKFYNDEQKMKQMKTKFKKYKK